MISPAMKLGIPILLAMLLTSGPAAGAQGKADKSFQAVLTDAQGVETDVKNVIFYWEEKISEVAFVPHELKQIPVKRGTTTVNVKFDTIKIIDVKPSSDPKILPTLMITLTNGKTGEFTLAIDGKFKGESDFGEVELPASGLKKVVLK
ncbi:MAG: hypothetical protein FJ248_00595 [Nitrospira sp.]|nr:hypothetical protein [Nitrospira sp.]